MALGFAGNQDEVVRGFYEVEKIGLGYVTRIHIAMYQDLGCRQGSKHAGQFAAQASRKSVDDQARGRGQFNRLESLFARNPNRELRIQDYEIKLWKGPMNLGREW